VPLGFSRPHLEHHFARKTRKRIPWNLESSFISEETSERCQSKISRFVASDVIDNLRETQKARFQHASVHFPPEAAEE